MSTGGEIVTRNACAVLDASARSSRYGRFAHVEIPRCLSFVVMSPGIDRPGAS